MALLFFTNDLILRNFDGPSLEERFNFEKVRPAINFHIHMKTGFHDLEKFRPALNFHIHMKMKMKRKRKSGVQDLE
jgi:hypothetical protein